jgi:FkbM family methyltransferase
MIKTAVKKLIPFHLRYYLRHKFYPSSVNEDTTLRKEFYSWFVKEGDLVFDVGANYGNRIKAFLGLKAKVVAIEPQESCYKFLGLMFGKKIHLVTKGLGAKEETRKFFIADSSTVSTFSEEYIKAVKDSGRFANNKWNKTTEIQMTTLDNLIRKFGVPSFIKIDVEGFEKEVLSGLTQKIKALSFEYCVPEQLEQVLACINLLSVSNPEMKYNYSTGESMKFELERWLIADEMISLVKSEKFSTTGFGDVYGKNFD